MSMSKVASLFAVVVASSFSVAACAASTDSPAVDEPAASDTQDLSAAKHRCGPFLNGACPSGYSCDMSSVPPHNVGGSGVCRKKICVQNVICAISSHFDHAKCACEPNAPSCAGTGGTCMTPTACDNAVGAHDGHCDGSAGLCGGTKICYYGG